MTEFRKDIVTALVDEEIIDPVFKQESFSKIESDESLAIDYKAQLLIKNLVKEKVIWKTTPNKVKAKVLRKINSKAKVENSGIFLPTIFDKPAFSFSTVIVVIFAVILIIINRQVLFEKKDYSSEQRGSNNMFVQAQSNFNSILVGKLTPQFISENSNEINSFFKENGVKYSTTVPDLKNWRLLGAVVSEDNGEKFAHHVYVNHQGNLAYLFQVDESYLKRNEVVTLSDDLLKYLDNGNCYSTFSNGSTTLFTKVEKNIFAVVSNVNQIELEKSFCSL